MLRSLERPLVIAFLGIALSHWCPARAQDNPVQEAIRQRIGVLRASGELRIGAAQVAATRVLALFYERREFLPAWVEPSTIDAMFRGIDSSQAHGLVPEDYHREPLSQLRTGIESSPAPAAEMRADFDLLLTDALLRLGYHDFFGKVDPERLDPNWNLARELGNMDPVAAIQEAIDSGSPDVFLDNLAPRHPYYERLQTALAHYRQIAAAGGWSSVPPGPTLRNGMQDERVTALRARLNVTGDLEKGAASDPALFDAPLEAAVQRFQERHRLGADGAVGAGTLQALNVPVAARIDQIRVNLERARWVLHDLGADFVIVNVAGFQVALFRGGKSIWSARSQVGKPYRETPVFRSEMQYLVFNPDWTVPPTILAQDILPAMRRDPSYLATKRLQVLDGNGKSVDPGSIDWSRNWGSSFPYVLRQQPGPDNALGLVKFIFPNKHFVFLHDTPSKALFEKEDRAFSSGCIRVEKPFELVELLLDDPKQWSRQHIEAVIQSGKTRTVYLREPLPVLLLYWTAAVDDAGRLHFIPDVYQRDPDVLQHLEAPFRLRERDAPPTTTEQR